VATESSNLRKLYGLSKSPIKASRAFVKDMEHFKSVNGRSWILVNDQDGTRVSINTYNDQAGKNYVPQVHPLPADDKAFEKLVKGYTEVAVADCPVAEAIKATKPAKATKAKASV
jgi:hypothetical protein